MLKKISESPLLQKIFFGNTILDYIVFLIIFFLGILIVYIILKLAIKGINKIKQDKEDNFYDYLISALNKTIQPLLYYAVLYFSLNILTLKPVAVNFFRICGTILLTLLGIRFILMLVLYSITQAVEKEKVSEIRKKTLKGLMPAIKIVIWVIGILFLLSNLGFNISTLVAGLGIGGIAVALASQAILGDLFSYVSILVDQPFEIGDFIIVDNYMGAVERIGIKTTRIRSLSGEQLILSNSDLTKSRLRNYKRMEKRRASFKLGVIYQTTQDQLKQIPGMIKEIIENIKHAVFDRCHFFSFEDFSLNYEIVYHVLSSDYNKYMNIQQEINLKIIDQFEEQGIQFAYPTQSIFLEKTTTNNSN